MRQLKPRHHPAERTRTGLGDSAGHLHSITRALMDRHLAPVAWRCCTAGPIGPRALSASATAQQGRGCQAVTATPCQSPGATPRPQGPQSPRNCTPGLECASNLVKALGAQSGGPGRVGLPGMSAQPCHPVPSTHMARLEPLMPSLALASSSEHCLLCAFPGCTPGLALPWPSPASPAREQTAGAVWGAEGTRR